MIETEHSKHIKRENYCELYNILWVIASFYCGALDEIQESCDYVITKEKVRKLEKLGLVKKNRSNKLWYATPVGREWLALMDKVFGE